MALSMNFAQRDPRTGAWPAMEWAQRQRRAPTFREITEARIRLERERVDETPIPQTDGTGGVALAASTMGLLYFLVRLARAALGA